MDQTPDQPLNQLVLIVWSDAAHVSPGQWLNAALDDTAVTITTVGLLVKLSESHVVVAQSRSDEGDLTGVFSIPRSNVQTINVLQQERKNKRLTTYDFRR